MTGGTERERVGGVTGRGLVLAADSAVGPRSLEAAYARYLAAGLFEDLDPLGR